MCGHPIRFAGVGSGRVLMVAVAQVMSKYWICPKCYCINAEDHHKCDECGCPIDIVLLLPNAGDWVQFQTTNELDEWISMMRLNMGAKVHRHVEANTKLEKCHERNKVLRDRLSAIQQHYANFPQIKEIYVPQKKDDSYDWQTLSIWQEQKLLKFQEWGKVLGVMLGTEWQTW